MRLVPRRDHSPINLSDGPNGICGGCNYDLKGTLEAGKFECPECGKIYDPNQPAGKPDWLLIVLIVVLTLNIIGNGTCGILMFR